MPDVNASATGNTQHVVTCRLDYSSTIYGSASGDVQHELTATVEAFTPPEPPPVTPPPPTGGTSADVRPSSSLPLGFGPCASYTGWSPDA